jgi:hypothetical protein
MSLLQAILALWNQTLFLQGVKLFSMASLSGRSGDIQKGNLSYSFNGAGLKTN